MLDVHDRHPVVLSSENATTWMDLSWTAKQMKELVRTSALPTEAFEWHQVTREVNWVGNDGPHMVGAVTAE
jgi:putative SOS response-associated peptidase YedK